MKCLITFAIALLSACSHTPSFDIRSEHSKLYSPAMGKDMAFSVYTPPNWHKDEALPLLVLLHGARDNERTFDRYGVGTYLDEKISQGLMPRVIVVNPDGGMGFWENWHDGSHYYRDWVIKDLMPHVKNQYNTLDCPEHCFVTGMSMGGHGAIRFAYYEPNTFSSVASISAPIFNAKDMKGKNSFRTKIMKLFIPTKKIWGDFNGDHIPKDLDPFISWVEKEEMKDTRLMLAWGDKESNTVKQTNSRFSEHLKQKQREHKVLEYSGGHKWIYWRPIIADSIMFHTQRENDYVALKQAKKPVTIISQ